MIVRLRHAVVCPLRSRFRRWRHHQPFWADDKTAAMLGVGQYGCHRCGKMGDCTVVGCPYNDPCPDHDHDGADRPWGPQGTPGAY